MDRNKILLKNIITYALGNFGSKFIGFILLPLYTHYLSVSDYGYLGLISVSVSFIIPIITFQIFDGLYRFLIEVDSIEERKKVISSCFFKILKNLIIFNLLYLLLILFVNFKYQFLILLQINFSIFAGLFLQSARGLKKNINYSLSGVISTIVVSSISITLIVFCKMKVDGIIIAQIFGSISVLIYLSLTLDIIKYINVKYLDSKLSKSIIKYSIPLIPNVMCWWIMNLSDRYMLSFFKGIESVGIYTVANKFPSLLMFVNSIFYLAWQENAITNYKAKDKNQYYTNIFKVFMVLEFTAVFVLITSTKFIMNIMVDAKFFIAWKYTLFLYFGAMFSAFSSFYGTGYQSSKETMGAFTTTIFAASINILINLIFIPIIGIQAASLSTMLAFLSLWLMRLIQTKKYFMIRINIKQLLLLAIFSIIFSISIYITKISYLNEMFFLFSIILFLIYNKSLITKGVFYGKYFANNKKR